MARPAPTKKIRLGQFYTSADVTRFMLELSDAPISARVMEPGHGEGAFIDALVTAGYDNVVAYDVDPYNHEVITGRYGHVVDARLSDYLAAPRDEQFELIIGNPPYVQWNNIDDELRSFLQRDEFWKAYANGEWDLLYAFIIWSVEKLVSDGELIFIVPFNWFHSTYACGLRRYLAQRGHFTDIVHFSEYKLFEDCAPNAVIFKYVKSRSGRLPRVRVAEFDGRRGNTAELVAQARDGLAALRAGQDDLTDGDWRFFTSAQPPVDGLWYLASREQERAIADIESSTGGLTLADRCQVAVGVVSGYDQAFALTGEQFQALPAAERAVVSPLVKARGCQRYSVTEPVPFIFTEGVESEEQLRERYPTIYRHLLAHREKLEARYSQNRQWWQWATVRNLEVFREHASDWKIFVPSIDRSPVARFSATRAEVLGSGDVVCVAAGSLLEESVLYVLAWLNSPQVLEWYRIKGARTGHRTRYTHAYVSQMPYRVIDFASARERQLHDQIVGRTETLVGGPPAGVAAALGQANAADFAELLAMPALGLAA